MCFGDFPTLVKVEFVKKVTERDSVHLGQFISVGRYFLVCFSLCERGQRNTLCVYVSELIFCNFLLFWSFFVYLLLLLLVPE